MNRSYKHLVAGHRAGDWPKENAVLRTLCMGCIVGVNVDFGEKIVNNKRATSGQERMRDLDILKREF